MSCSASVEEPHLEPVLGRERPRIGAVRLLTGENAIDADVRGARWDGGQRAGD